MSAEKIFEFFGTPHLENMTALTVYENALRLLPKLWDLDYKNKNIDPKSINDIFKLLEIIQYGKDRFPFLLMLSFNEQNEIYNIQLWNDPHYDADRPRDKNNALISAFTAKKISNPDLFLFYNNPKILFSYFDELLRDKNQPKQICIGGDSDCNLVIGLPNPKLFPYRDCLINISAFNTPFSPQAPAKA